MRAAVCAWTNSLPATASGAPCSADAHCASLARGQLLIETKRQTTGTFKVLSRYKHWCLCTSYVYMWNITFIIYSIIKTHASLIISSHEHKHTRKTRYNLGNTQRPKPTANETVKTTTHGTRAYPAHSTCNWSRAVIGRRHDLGFDVVRGQGERLGVWFGGWWSLKDESSRRATQSNQTAYTITAAASNKSELTQILQIAICHIMNELYVTIFCCGLRNLVILVSRNRSTTSI